MLDTKLIEARLRAPEVDLEQVRGAADFAAVKRAGDARPGWAYVVLAAEENAAGDSPQARMKTAARAAFGVIVSARNYRDSTGAAAKDDLAALVGRTRAALLGWAPQGCMPCVWLKGEVLDYDNDTLLWMDLYATSHVLGGPS